MNPVQAYIDHLSAELVRSLPGLTVEAREPTEGELAAGREAKQIFVTTEGIEMGEQIADLGLSTVVRVPVMVACVMPRPSTPLYAAQTLRRRLQVMQAIQRANRTFCQDRTDCLLNIIQESPSLIEGFYVSITGIEIEFDLISEEKL